MPESLKQKITNTWERHCSGGMNAERYWISRFDDVPLTFRKSNRHLLSKVSSIANGLVDLWGRNTCRQRVAGNRQLHPLAGTHPLNSSILLLTRFVSGIPWLLLPLPQPGPLPLPNRFSPFHLFKPKNNQNFFSSVWIQFRRITPGVLIQIRFARGQDQSTQISEQDQSTQIFEPDQSTQISGQDQSTQISEPGAEPGPRTSPTRRLTRCLAAFIWSLWWTDG